MNVYVDSRTRYVIRMRFHVFFLLFLISWLSIVSANLFGQLQAHRAIQELHDKPAGAPKSAAIGEFLRLWGLAQSFSSHPI